MTARFRSAFFGSSGFVAVRPAARLVEGAVAHDGRGTGHRTPSLRRNASEQASTPDADVLRALAA